MLNGVTVLELGSYITAPLAALMLADLGADVIKVERPEGDPFRRARGGQYGPNFIAFNRNKRSVVLDFNRKDDVAKLRKLALKADVLLDNLRPSYLEKIGLDGSGLRDANPRLIHCSITGFGTTGPYSARPAFDAVGQALSGISSMIVDPESPVSSGPTVSDNTCGMYACYAILGALYEREKTGRGRRLEINMLETSMAFIQDVIANFTRRGTVFDRFSRVATSQSYIVKCLDSKLLAVHLSTADKFWSALVTQVLEDEALGANARYDSHPKRVEHYLELRAALESRFRSRSRIDWMTRLEAADVPFAPVNTVEEAVADPQVAALDIFVDLVHPAEGAIRAVRCPVLADGKRPQSASRPPPTLGEHTAEVLRAL
jgi:crotonobetainyl-CoA:carnitine CoA-transferase CaiB-like acyl-CoA transferase